MAYFAKIEKQADPFDKSNDNYWVVKTVVAISNDTPLSVGKLGEHQGHVEGEDYCRKLFKTGIWKQTSYNTRRGVHYQQDGTVSEDQSLAFRENYAGVGRVYNPTKDVFLDPQPFQSWYFSNQNIWVCPVVFPTVTTYIADDGLSTERLYRIRWNEAGQKWTAVKTDPPQDFETTLDRTEPKNVDWQVETSLDQIEGTDNNPQGTVDWNPSTLAWNPV